MASLESMWGQNAVFVFREKDMIKFAFDLKKASKPYSLKALGKMQLSIEWV